MLDILVEERGGDSDASAWVPARSLRMEQVKVLLGGKEIPLDVFEPWCSPVREASEASLRAGSSPAVRAATAPHRRYVLFFDFEHLYLGGLASALQAAEHWAKGLSRSTDEVMLIEGGQGMRIVREMRPVSDDLHSAIRAVRDDFRRGERWAEGEWHRIQEIDGAGVRADTLASSYASVDYSKTRASLEHLRDVMSSLESIEGTKNLVLFADTIRLIPGEEYPSAPPQLPDVLTYLKNFAQAANERNVRIYSMQPGTDRQADDSSTMLSTETGGRYIERTNRISAVFDSMAVDLSCFYRIGFRFRPGYTGHAETITVRIADGGHPYRVRHRRTLEDPTREQRDIDALRAAYFRPSTARGFPSTVRAEELFRHERGSRLRVQVEVPLQELLALPAPGTDRLEIRLQIGGQVVPLRTGGMVKGPSTEREVWADVETAREPLGFGRQASLSMRRSAPAGERPRRVVQAIDIDVPPGPYRIVSVVQDQTTRSLSAAVTDIVSEPASTVLGAIGIAVEDPRAIVLRGDDEKDRRIARRHRDKLVTATMFLPSGSLVVEGRTVEAGLALHLFYGVCGEIRDGMKLGKRDTAATPFEGWRLQRTLSCGSSSSPEPFPEKTIPPPDEDEACVPVVDTMPPARLRPGPCRFEIVLLRPGVERESRSLDFQVVAAD